MEDSSSKKVTDQNSPQPPSPSSGSAGFPGSGATAPDPPAVPRWRDLSKPRRRPGGPEAGPEQRAREEAFWQRYETVVRASGVKPGVEVWYRRHVEAFVRSIQPQRLAQAGAAEVTRFLQRLWQSGRCEGWQVRQAEAALWLLYQQVVRVPWAQAWPVLAPETPEAPDPKLDYRKPERRSRPGAARVRQEFAGPLDRMIRTLRYRHYAYRTEETYRD